MIKALQTLEFHILTSIDLLLSNHYALTHPSQPNYIASEGGFNFGLDNNGFVTIPKNVSTVVDLFDTQTISWKEYVENIPSPGFQGMWSADSSGDKWLYERKHNSLISYDSISTNTTRLSNIVGFNSFNQGLTNHILPQFSIMVPNLLNDAYNTSLPYAANWTSTFLTPLRRNPYFTHRTLILLHSTKARPTPSPTISSPFSWEILFRGLRDTNDSTLYTNCSILSTLENDFGLPNLGRYDVDLNVFSVVVDKTGYENNVTINPPKAKLNKSCPGYLNSKSKVAIPNPNPFLTGAGGMGMMNNGLSQILIPTQVDTPYNGAGAVVDGKSGNQPINVVVDRSRTSTPSQTPRSSDAAGWDRKTLSGRVISLIAGMIGIAGFFLFFG